MLQKYIKVQYYDFLCEVIIVLVQFILTIFLLFCCFFLIQHPMAYRDLHAQLVGKVALFMPGGKYASSQSGNAAAIADALKFYLESREKVCVLYLSLFSMYTLVYVESMIMLLI